MILPNPFLSADQHSLPAEERPSRSMASGTVRGLDFQILWRAITDDLIEFIDAPVES